MHAYTPAEHLLEFWADTMFPIELVHFGMDLAARLLVQQGQPLELFGDAPAFLTVETEDECRRLPRRRRTLGHPLHMLGEELVGDVLISERDTAFLAFH
ncbi:hypothetical protein HRbin36_02795 [bacterium HR36]|nr:hypothetical protein HRbin36_02795 [bacterium HR36]